MRKETILWVIEYLLGISFLVAALPFIVHPQQGWSSAHGWAYLLFIACAGIALVSSASGTRQRIELSKRIKALEEKLNEKHPSYQGTENHTHGQEGTLFINKEHLVGSIN